MRQGKGEVQMQLVEGDIEGKLAPSVKAYKNSGGEGRSIDRES